MRTASIAAVLVSSLFLASGVVAPLWGFTATSLPTRTTGFLVGAPGALALAGPEGADATMAVDGVTVLQIVWADCFGLYGSGNFRLDMLGVPVGENGGVAAGPDDPRLGLVSVPAVLEDGCWVAEGYYRVPDEFNRGSDAALTVRFATVEARFIPDVGGPELLSLLFPPLGRLYTALYLATFVSGGDLFGALGHDGVVGRVSQEGGLASAATTLFGFPDGIHLGILFLSPGNTGSEAYSARVRELLDTPTSSPEWGLLPAPAAPLAVQPSQTQPAPAGEAPPKPARSGVAGPEFGLTITSPAPGTLVASGATITVVVEPDAGLTVDPVLVVGPNGADLDTEAPFEVAFTVPEEAFGSYSIAAFGKNATTEEYYASPDVSLTVQPVAALESIELGPAPAFLVGAGDTVRLSVTGWFADGVPREVAASEVAFSVAPGGIVDVESEGVVTALAIGQATVEALFENHSASLVVEVLPPGPLIFIDNFESGDLSWWSASVP